MLMQEKSELTRNYVPQNKSAHTILCTDAISEERPEKTFRAICSSLVSVKMGGSTSMEQTLWTAILTFDK